MCGIPSLCHGPYLGITVVSGIASTAFLSAKACLYNTFDSRNGISPVVAAAVEREHRLGFPLLLISSAVFALVHIVVAYKSRCQARRKLTFFLTDAESVSVCKISGNTYPRNLPLFGKLDLDCRSILGGKYDSDKDVPARMLADKQSLFMDCKGLVLHYKVIEGSFYHSQADDTAMATGIHATRNLIPFPTTWNPLSRTPAAASSLHVPLLSNSLSQFAISLDLNERPAIMQQSAGQKSSGLFERLDFLSKGDSKLTKQQPLHDKDTGVVLLHGFGGGLFSWRHVMGSIAREVGCRIAAFDRPGWGLTSRPRRSEWETKGLPNPYDLHTQVDLLFAFCHELGLRSVVLVGHADGGLLALMAAARALKSKDSIQVEVKGLVLIGVSLSREIVPPFARVLLHTSLARNMLRPLLRSEIGQVTTRRAWHDASKLTSETLDLYKGPLHVEGWDKALAEVSKACMSSAVLSSASAVELVRCVTNLPALVVAGVQDCLVPLKTAQSLTSQLPLSKLAAIPGCGHLVHEECPTALLSSMIPFISRYLYEQMTDDLV
jgi:pimeloyl-ACP methyl ester carboxylesterase